MMGGGTQIARRKRDVPNNKEIPSVVPYVPIDSGIYECWQVLWFGVSKLEGLGYCDLDLTQRLFDGIDTRIGL